jgi:hypothetical protein
MLIPSRLHPQVAVDLRLAVFGLLLAACSSGAVLPPSSGRLALGTWGGDNAGVIVSDSGTHVHVGCTLGDMPGLVPLDPDGRFVINGSYVLRAYPIMVGPTLPAQFSGKVLGRTLIIAIAVNDRRQTGSRPGASHRHLRPYSEHGCVPDLPGSPPLALKSGARLRIADASVKCNKVVQGS